MSSFLNLVAATGPPSQDASPTSKVAESGFQAAIFLLQAAQSRYLLLVTRENHI